MKIVVASLAALLAASFGALVLPVLNQAHIVAKTVPRAEIRRIETERRRIDGVFDAFRRGDRTREAEARAAMRALPAYEERRFDFANVLLARGHARAAYELAKPKAHFAEFSLPNDLGMEFYARLAARAGHPEEAAWARERMGEDGHFRVWTRGEEHAFSFKNGSAFPTGKWSYEKIVNIHMNTGLGLYPSHREEIEALRQRLLAAP